MYEALACGLLDNGVKTLFGLIGDANLFLVQSYSEQSNAQFVPAVHEGSAVLMAHGYAHKTGSVGVATVTHGPALTNCITALTDAVRAKASLVLMAGDTPTTHPQHLQNTDQREVAKLCGAGFEQLQSPATANRDLARAIYRAKAERRHAQGLGHHAAELSRGPHRLGEGSDVGGEECQDRRPIGGRWLAQTAMSNADEN
jgi:thiamine pyrophosphate-dependent acetolactate synthase large subunit-like protein